MKDLAVAYRRTAHNIGWGWVVLGIVLAVLSFNPTASRVVAGVLAVVIAYAGVALLVRLGGTIEPAPEAQREAATLASRDCVTHGYSPLPGLSYREMKERGEVD